MEAGMNRLARVMPWALCFAAALPVPPESAIKRK